MARRTGRSGKRLLVRRPLLSAERTPSAHHLEVKAQLDELAQLREQGLLSDAEYERQRRKVLDD